jgi:putative superfamily III holin-X
MTAPTPPPAPDGRRVPDVENASVGELLGDVSRDLSTLLRQELALAKAELRQEAAKAGRGAGMLGGAGFASYMVLLFLSFALWWALANVMDEGLAALLVALVWAVAGAVLYATGRRRLRAVRPVPERTVDTLKQVPNAMTPHEERS